MVAPGQQWRGLSFGELRPDFKRSGWTICVGAGASRPVFPDWSNLTKDFSESGPAFDEIKAFGLDAVLQAKKERDRVNDDRFSQRLARSLYDSILTSARLTPREKAIVMHALAATRSSDLTQALWDDFLSIISDCYTDGAGNSAVSSLALARVYRSAWIHGCGPSAVLSFNAEPLLYALLLAERQCRPPAERDAIPLVAPLVGATSFCSPGRVPYCYCHGLLSVPWMFRRVHRHRVAAQHLVFSEAQYLAVAGRAFSWQSSTFFRAAVSRRIVFVGVSLTDPNMRRWLAWVHEVRSEEKAADPVRFPDPTEPFHYWLNVRSNKPDPAGPLIDSWIESAVAHLGVRLIWLDSWSEVGPALRRMLGLR